MISQTKKHLFDEFHQLMIDIDREGLNPIVMINQFVSFSSLSPLHPLSCSTIEDYKNELITNFSETPYFLNYLWFWNFCLTLKSKEQVIHDNTVSAYELEINRLSLLVQDNYFKSSIEKPLDISMK